LKNEYPQRGNENIIKETMLSLEGAALQSAREKHFDYVADARLDRSEPIEGDEQAQVEIPSDLSGALDERRYEIGEGEASFSLVCGSFRAVPGLDLFASLASPVDVGAGENENDNDPAFLTTRRREYPPHTPDQYLVAAQVAHRSQRGRSAVRVRSSHSRCPKNSIEQPSMQEFRHALWLHHNWVLAAAVLLTTSVLNPPEVSAAQRANLDTRTAM
jgi:hypothetical protein